MVLCSTRCPNDLWKVCKKIPEYTSIPKHIHAHLRQNLPAGKIYFKETISDLLFIY